MIQKVDYLILKKKTMIYFFLDNHMPGFTGVNNIQTLEREKILKKQKIILFSGADFTSAQIDDLLKKDGVHACLKKPIQLHDLLTEITC